MDSIPLSSMLHIRRRLRRAGALSAGAEVSLILLCQLCFLPVHHDGLLLGTHMRVEPTGADGGAVDGDGVGEIRAAVWCALVRFLEVLLPWKTRAWCLGRRRE